MAIDPLIVWRNGNGGTDVQALRLLNGTVLDATQLGAATGFSATTFDAGVGGRFGHNRGCEFRKNIYAYHNGTTSVYRFNFGTQVWDLVHTLSPAPNTGDDQSVSAIHQLNVNGELRMYIFWQQSSSVNARAAWTNDGSTWNTSGILANSSSWPIYELSYEEKLWIVGSGSGTWEIYTFDPKTNGISGVPVVGTGISTPRGGQLLNFKGRLFLFGAVLVSTGRQPPVFKELVGGGFDDVTSSGGSDPGVFVGGTTLIASQGPLAVFEWDDKIYVVVADLDVTNTVGQMRVFEFIPNSSSPGGTFQENEISSSVIPAAWLSGGAFEGSFTARTGLMVHVQTSTPGSPEIFFWRVTDQSVTAQSTFWTWNGNASLMTVVNSDVDRSLNIVQGADIGGQFIYTEGDFDVTLENPVSNADGMSFDFQAHDPLDGTSISDKQGKLYYALGESDWAEATLNTSVAPTVLSGGDPAPTISANTLQGIAVGTSKFRATWDAVADGFTTPGEYPMLKLDVL